MTCRRPQPLSTSIGRRAVFPAIGATWLALVAAGMGAIWKYESTPGVAAAAVPAAATATDASLVTPGRTSLVVFLHPQCPCSVATLDAIDRLIASSGDRLGATAVFADVGDGASDASDGPAWRRAATVGRLRVVRDTADGAIARRFDARTSGQVLCYDAGGALAFSGGVTPGRGIAGESDGARTVAAIVAGQTPRVHKTDVFGCELN